MCAFWLLAYPISDRFEWVVPVPEYPFIPTTPNNIVNKIVVMICLTLTLSSGSC